MIHARQSLAFRFEAGDDFTAVESGFDDLQRDHAMNRYALLGLVDRSHSPFADHLDDAIAIDLVRVWRAISRRGRIGRRERGHVESIGHFARKFLWHKV